MANAETWRIGLVSDTHGVFDEQLASVFAGCDEIWHAGEGFRG
jgi:hypothetical protein